MSIPKSSEAKAVIDSLLPRSAIQLCANEGPYSTLLTVSADGFCTDADHWNWHKMDQATYFARITPYDSKGAYTVPVTIQFAVESLTSEPKWIQWGQGLKDLHITYISRGGADSARQCILASAQWCCSVSAEQLLFGDFGVTRNTAQGNII